MRLNLVDKRALAGLALGALACGALAPPLGAQITNDPAAVHSGTFHTDPDHTLVTFDVNHLGLTEYYGVFPDATGTLVLTKSLADAHVDISVPVAHVSTTNATLDGELRGPEWFDAQRYPTIHFVSNHIVSTGPQSARIEGTITMHGVSRPLTLDATLGGSGVNPMSKVYTIGFKATGHLRRSDFGVAKYVPLVSDEVTLTIAAAFEGS